MQCMPRSFQAKSRVLPAAGGFGPVTLYVAVAVLMFPALSTAVTVKLFVPAAAVSTGEPLGAVPVHVAMPAVESVHVKLAVTDWLRLKVAPEAGWVIVTEGGVASRLIVTDDLLVPPR